ncbi:hypothetical protein GE09DRAFT_1211512 [Coniochaeta sp. 2T2.1]|nr:hypothetical protein GE09DRAFT_1211512 [Coniochaeta sp. 2T2.1]
MQINYFEAKSDALGFTAFLWLEHADSAQLDELEQMDRVRMAYFYEQWIAGQRGELISSDDEDEEDDDMEDKIVLETSFAQNWTKFEKRDSRQGTPFWKLSQVSTPKHGDWMGDQRLRGVDPNTNGVLYNHYYHHSSGAGQFVYVTEDGIWGDHQEFAGKVIEHRPGANYAVNGMVPNTRHGTQVVSKIVGRLLGIVKNTVAVILDKKTMPILVEYKNSILLERWLESFLNAADDIVRKGRASKSVLTISHIFYDGRLPYEFFEMMHSIFLELDNLGTSIVVSSGNFG